MAKKTTRHSARKHPHPVSSKRAKHDEQKHDVDTDKLPIGSPLQHPDAVHLQHVEQLPTELQSIITDLQNNRDQLVSDVMPSIGDRLQQVRATVLRLVQGPHTAAMIGADQPPSPIVSHSTPTRGGLVTGVSRPSARAARGAQAANAETDENNPPGIAPHNPPPQTPAAEQEEGAHA